MPEQELELEVFRAGDYGDKGRWTEANLAQIAADYDPAAHEAPVTLDHAQTGPAWGWVRGLRAAGPVLLATLGQLSDELKSLLAEGRFKKRSIELYPTLPATGRLYLRAVSFLGAAAPEVKGLADPLFTDDPADVLRLPFDDEQTSQGALPSSPSPAESAPPVHLSESAAPADKATPALPIQSFSSIPSIASMSSNPAATQRDIESDCRSLEREGRLPPAWREAGITAFMEALHAAENDSTLNHSMSLQFGERGSSGERTGKSAASAASPYAWFIRFLESLPPMIPMSEATPRFSAAFEPAPPPPGVPASARVSPASLERHRRALALLAATPALTYSEALLKSCSDVGSGC